MILIVLIPLLSSEATSQAVLDGYGLGSKSNYYDWHKVLSNNSDSNFVRHKGYKPILRADDFWSTRTDTNGMAVSIIETYKELQSFKTKYSLEKPLNSEKWIELGPRSPQKGHLKNLSGSGRLNCLAFDLLDSSRIWAGSASGGLWHSTDYGKSWDVIPFTEFMSVGISDIQISPSNPQVVYAATGDADGGSFFGSYSIGIIKSTDRGENWEILDLGFEYSDSRFISKILVSSSNSNLVYAATNNEILRSTDGGASWESILDGYFFRDLIFNKFDEKKIYASTFNIDGNTYIFQSDDGGNSWYIVKSFSNISRIKLASSPFDPDLVMGLCVNSKTSSFGGIYISRNSGDSWSEFMPIDDQNDIIVSAQGFFNLVLEFSPFDKNELYAGGVWLYKLNLKNSSIAAIPGDIHVDQHNIIFNLQDSTILIANDGGIYETDKNFKTSKNLSNGLGITQFYRIGLNPNSDRFFSAGSQDNNMYAHYFDSWLYLASGDGMESFFDPKDPSHIYFSTQRGNLYSTKHGFLWVDNTEVRPWVTEFMMSPLNSNHLYCGYQNVWKSENQGENWEKISEFNSAKTISTISINPENDSLIVTGNADELYRTHNNGMSWDRILSSTTPIKCSAFLNKDSVFVGFGGFTKSKKVYLIDEFSDYDHTFNLPNIPVNCIEIDSVTAVIYVGTDYGVFHKGINDTVWLATGEGLPGVIVNELEIHYGTGQLFAATFGRGVWTYKLRSCNAEKPIMNLSKKVNFCPLDSIDLYVSNPNPDCEYIWSDGTIGLTNSLNKSGNYFVSAVNSSGCVASSDTVLLLQVPKMYLKLQLLSANPICEGDTASLKVTVGATQQITNQKWSNGLLGEIASITQSGIYYYQAEDEFSCKAYSDSIEIIVNPIPPKPSIIKSGNWLIASDADFYTWFLDDIKLTDYTGKSLYIEKTGKYRVEVRDKNYCSNISNENEVIVDQYISAQYSLATYPLPTAGLLNIEMDLKEETFVDILIYDTVGNLLLNKHLPNRKGYLLTNLDFSTVAESIYLMRVVTQFGSKDILVPVLR